MMTNPDLPHDPLDLLYFAVRTATEVLRDAERAYQDAAQAERDARRARDAALEQRKGLRDVLVAALQSEPGAMTYTVPLSGDGTVTVTVKARERGNGLNDLSVAFPSQMVTVARLGGAPAAFDLLVGAQKAR